MQRVLSLALSGFVAAGAVKAAAVQAYDVDASARMTLTSARFGDGSDASGGFLVSYDQDLFDDFPQSSGNASVFTDFTRDDATGTFAVETSGTADVPFGSSTGSIQGRLAQIFENVSTAPITLIFDYAIGAGASASDGIGDYFFDTFVALSTDDAEIFRKDIGLFSLPLSEAGTTSATFGPGARLYAFSYAEAFGTAFAFGPAPVPLPASLPLLAAGLAAFLGLRRRC